MSHSGNDLTPPELLIYWIRERYRILTKKQEGLPSPWSEDRVFQTTYFCNVRREDDKVTKWIRNFYSPHVNHPFFEYNIILSRFLNWPLSLKGLGFVESHDPVELQKTLEGWAEARFQVWGGAYLITTHGMKMPKATYLARNVLGSAVDVLEHGRAVVRGASCGAAAQVLERIEGVGSFLAAQIVADLKNTVGHPLMSSEDRWTFVSPGPGSIRGVSWFCNGDPKSRATPAYFSRRFEQVRQYVDATWPEEVPRIDNQDLQNCLCEFDKYMRVRNGTGRSKRRYNGT